MSDEEHDDIINEREHDALLQDIKHLDKPLKRKKTTSSTKPAKKKAIVEKKGVLDDLVGAISSTRNVSELKTHLEDTDEKTKRRRQTLDKPLHRQARERVEAGFVYKEAKKELRGWDPIVHENRAAEQLFFPLNDPNTFFGTTTTEKARTFTPRTDFEKKLFEALGKNVNASVENEETEAERELLDAMNLKEAKKRTSKLQRMRSLMSYTASKNARESKIKSKKYHRVKKREERKRLIKEIEDLLVKDPEAAKLKLGELDKDRAYERATLKHRGTGKWSVQLRQYASKNPGMQRLITEHLKLGRELKGKHGLDRSIRDSDDSEEETNKPLTRAEILELAADQAQRELDAEEKLRDSKIKKASEDPKLKDKLQAIRRKPVEKEISTIKLADVDLLLADGDSGEEDNDGFLAQAFNADDVVGEFDHEKNKVEEDSKPKDIDNRLFGWGSWTGHGISDEKQTEKMNRFIKKAKVVTRKDQGKKGLIIREELAYEGIEKLQPRDVPFPFTAVKDFEAITRQPIGKDWNTNMAHRSLVKRTVNTKAGRIIRPMQKHDELRKTTEEIFDKDDY